MVLFSRQNACHWSSAIIKPINIKSYHASHLGLLETYIEMRNKVGRLKSMTAVCAYGQTCIWGTCEVIGVATVALNHHTHAHAQHKTNPTCLSCTAHASLKAHVTIFKKKTGTITTGRTFGWLTGRTQIKNLQLIDCMNVYLS